MDIRPSAHTERSADTIRIRPESGIKHDDLWKILNFENPKSTMNFLNQEFMPAMRKIAEQGKFDVAAGKDPKAFWKMPESLSLAKPPRKAGARTSGEKPLAKGAARINGELTTPPKPLSYISTTDRFFDAFFRAKGYGPEKVAGVDQCGA